MKCKELKYNYPDYISGKIDTETKKLIDKHIIICGSCKREIDSLKTVKTYLDTYKIQDPGEKYFINFLPRLNSELDKNSDNIKIPNWLTKIFLPALSLTIFLILVLTTVDIKDKSYLINKNNPIAQIDTVMDIGNDVLNIEPIESKIKYSVDYSQITEQVNDLLAQEILQAKNVESLYPSESFRTVVNNLSQDQLDAVVQQLKSTSLDNK